MLFRRGEVPGCRPLILLPVEWPHRVPALAASGLPPPIQAESSCRRQPRVNTVEVCADEPPARRPAGYPCWDQLSAADRDRLAGQLGQTIAALHQLSPPVIRDWWPVDWPPFVA